ncbi:hypothetical protein D1BOALGB6SA_3936 [Olavius sp. associated proteobacterium Delta 1]|nr:hypothetical protein D1BOALGB6SA_3936 [Olavius sp. associated proteobacterium Delta 1]
MWIFYGKPENIRFFEKWGKISITWFRANGLYYAVLCKY